MFNQRSIFLEKAKKIVKKEPTIWNAIEVKDKSLELTILITLNKHSDEDIVYLINYLYNAYYWSFKEIDIFYITMNKFPPQDIKNILKHMKTNFAGIFLSLLHYRELILLLCKAIAVLSCHGYKEEAKNIIDLIETQRKDNSLLTDSLYLINLYYATKGYWIYLYINQKEGNMIIKKFLDILSLSAKPQIFQYYQRIYNKYVK